MAQVIKSGKYKPKATSSTAKSSGPSYTTSGRDIVRDGKVVGTAPSAEAATTMAANSARKASGGSRSKSSTGPTTINQDTNEVLDSSGKVVAKGSSLAEALAKQTQLMTGSAPNVSGRPDLFAVAPGANQKVESFADKSTGTLVTPTTATADQLSRASDGTLDSFNKSQGLTYMDGPTFKDLQPVLSEADLIRGPNGQIWLRQGLTVDQVRARKETAVSDTGGATGDSLATDFSVDLPDSLTTDSLSSLLENPVTNTDFDRMLADIGTQQDALLALMVPGADEQATKAEILGIKDQIEKSLVELSMGLNNVEDQPIAMQFITGQQASIQRSADAKLQNLARIEQNLLYELGLEQDARKVQASVAETRLGYLQTNLDVAFKVKDMLRQEEDSIYNRARALKQDSQATLSYILESMQGMDEGDMSADQIGQLQALATSAGIPYSLIVSGLSNVKNQLKLKNSSTGIPGSVWSKEQLDLINTLTDDMRSDKNITDFNGVASGYQRVSDGVTLDSGQGDLAIVYGYMKMLDPTSVVREGEFATAEATAGLPAWIVSQYNKLLDGGRLDDGEGKTRAEFKRAAEQLYGTARANYDSSYSYYERRAVLSGLDPDLVLYYNSAGQTDASPTTGESSFVGVNRSFATVASLVADMPEVSSAVESLRKSGWTDDEILQAVEQNGGIGGFSDVGADTKQGAVILNKILAYETGSKGGQCGRFVNENAGTRMGDSYESKMSYVNVPNTKAPSPGDAFVMPYKSTGHTGFVVGARRLGDGTYDVTVMDSNWGLDERVRTHVINSRKISGYARMS